MQIQFSSVGRRTFRAAKSFPHIQVNHSKVVVLQNNDTDVQYDEP